MRRQLVLVSLGFRRLFRLSATPSTPQRASAFVNCFSHELTWGSNPDVGIDLTQTAGFSALFAPYSRHQEASEVIGLRDRPSHPYVCRSKLASNTTDPECEEAHFSCSISIATQTQTLFFSVVVSLASGCSMVYDQGGILPVEINPQIESSLARRWRAE